MTMCTLVTSLLLRKPFFGYILSSLQLEKNNSIETLETVPGPVVKLIYNPVWLEGLEEERAYAVLLHELLHILFLHAIRRSGRDTVLWNTACDLAVNEHLEKRRLPMDYLTVDKINIQYGAALESAKNAEYYYDELLKLKEVDRLNMAAKEGVITLIFPNDEEASVTIQKEGDLSDINRRAVQTAMEDISRQASEEGEIPGALMKNLTSVYASARVNWRSVLRKFLEGKGHTEVRKTVKRVSKRFDDMPGNRRTKGLEALIAIDESGSISPEEIRVFHRELRVLKRLTKARLMVTRFDTDCTPPLPLERFIRDEGRLKQGGTDFRPVFEMADRMNERLVIVFTDGDGRLPDTIKQRVLWLMTGDRDKAVRRMPFGETVRFTE